MMGLVASVACAAFELERDSVRSVVLFAARKQIEQKLVHTQFTVASRIERTLQFARKPRHFDRVVVNKGVKNNSLLDGALVLKCRQFIERTEWRVGDYQIVGEPLQDNPR